MPVNDDNYLVKLKNIGKSDEFISEKIGLPVGEVRRRWNSLMKAALEAEKVQFNDSSKLAAIIGTQMEVLGQSVRLLGSALNDRATPALVRMAIKACPPDEDLAHWLCEKLLILKPFKLPDSDPETSKKVG